jgi:two-component system sensor histidine kinase/response regulator
MEIHSVKQLDQVKKYPLAHYIILWSGLIFLVPVAFILSVPLYLNFESVDKAKELSLDVELYSIMTSIDVVERRHYGQALGISRSGNIKRTAKDLLKLANKSPLGTTMNPEFEALADRFETSIFENIVFRTSVFDDVLLLTVYGDVVLSLYDDTLSGQYFSDTYLEQQVVIDALSTSFQNRIIRFTGYFLSEPDATIKSGFYIAPLSSEGLDGNAHLGFLLFKVNGAALYNAMQPPFSDSFFKKTYMLDDQFSYLNISDSESSQLLSINAQDRVVLARNIVEMDTRDEYTQVADSFVTLENIDGKKHSTVLIKNPKDSSYWSYLMIQVDSNLLKRHSNLLIGSAVISFVIFIIALLLLSKVLKRLVLRPIFSTMAIMKRTLDTGIAPEATALNHSVLEIQQLYEVVNESAIELSRQSLLLNNAFKSAQDSIKENADIMQAVDKHGVYFVADIWGTITWANNALGSVLGVEAGELIGRNHRDLILNEFTKQQFDDVYADFLRGVSWNAEITNQTLDGREYQLRLTITPSINSEGKVQKFYGFGVDVTEQNRSIDEAIENETQLHLLLQNANANLYRYDMVNERFYLDGMNYQKLGYLFSDDLSSFEKWISLIHPDDKLRVVELYHPEKNAEKPIAIEYRMVGLDGQILWFLDAGPDRMERTASNVLHPIHSYPGIRIDITGSKELRQKNLENQAVLEAIFESSLEGQILTNTQGVVFNTSKNLTTYFSRINIIGLTMKQSLASFKRSIVEESNERLLDFVQRLGDDPIATQAISIHMVDGRSFTFTTAPFTIDNQYSGRIWTFVDVTDDENKKQELINQKIEAESANIAKSEFLAVISHEIRTPLNGVIGMLDLIRSEEGIPISTKNRVEMAINSGNRLVELMNEITQWSRIESGNRTLVKKLFEPEVVLFDSLKSLSALAKDKGISMIVEEDNQTIMPSLIMQGDVAKFKQVIFNIVGNAIKFTNAGSVTVKVGYDIGEKNLCTIRLQVIDTGIGIAKKDIGKLFTRFQRIDNSTSRTTGGTGLGLAITKSSIDIMGGTISISSELDRGTTVELTIPFLSINTLESDLNIPELTSKIVVITCLKNEVKGVRLSGYLRRMNVKHMAFESLEMLNAQIHSKDAPLRIENDETLFVLIDHGYGADLVVDCWGSIQKLLEPSVVHGIVLVDDILGSEEKRYATCGIDAVLNSPINYQYLYSAFSLIASKSPLMAFADPLINIEFLDCFTLPKSALTRADFDTTFGLGKRILVVDDQEINLHVARGILENFSFNVDTVSSGSEAIIQLLNSKDKQRYDVLLLDIQMPSMDGFQLCKNIREGQGGRFYSNVPIIAVSANTRKEDMILAFEAGMNDFIFKPVTQDIVIEKLANLLDFSSKAVQSNSGSSDVTNRPKPVKKPTDSSKKIASVVDTDQIWNKHELVERIGDSADLMSEILTSVIDDMPGKLDELSIHFAKKDLAGCKITLHTLKGIGANIGANELARLCKSAETYAETQAVAELSAAILAIKSSVAVLTDILSNDASMQSAGAVKARVSVSVDVPELLKILEALLDNIMSGGFVSHACLIDLQKLSASDENLAAKLTDISRNVSHFNYDKAMGDIRGLIKQLSTEL